MICEVVLYTFYVAGTNLSVLIRGSVLISVVVLYTFYVAGTNPSVLIKSKGGVLIAWIVLVHFM